MTIEQELWQISREPQALLNNYTFGIKLFWDFTWMKTTQLITEAWLIDAYRVRQTIVFSIFLPLLICRSKAQSEATLAFEHFLKRRHGSPSLLQHVKHHPVWDPVPIDVFHELLCLLETVVARPEDDRLHHFVFVVHRELLGPQHQFELLGVYQRDARVIDVVAEVHRNDGQQAWVKARYLKEEIDAERRVEHIARLHPVLDDEARVFADDDGRLLRGD